MCLSGGAGGLMSGAIGGLSAIAGYDAKVEDFNNEEMRWEENYTNSLADGAEQSKQLTLKAMQDDAVTGQKVQDQNYEGAINAAKAEASEAGSGVGGNSVDAVINGITAGAARNRQVAVENGNMVAAQITEEQKGVVADEVNHINSVPRPTPPNAGAAFLNVAGALLGGMGG